MDVAQQLRLGPVRREDGAAHGSGQAGGCGGVRERPHGVVRDGGRRQQRLEQQPHVLRRRRLVERDADGRRVDATQVQAARGSGGEGRVSRRHGDGDRTEEEVRVARDAQAARAQARGEGGGGRCTRSAIARTPSGRGRRHAPHVWYYDVMRAEDARAPQHPDGLRRRACGRNGERSDGAPDKPLGADAPRAERGDRVQASCQVPGQRLRPLRGGASCGTFPLTQRSIRNRPTAP